MIESIDVVLSTQLTVDAEAQILVIKNHSQLDNLDYGHSGHTGFASSNYVNEELDKKVDKVEGKELSENDFTDTYKNQVDTNLQNITNLVPRVEINEEDIENLETQLALYQYTRQQIVAMYLEDYSTFIGEVATILNYIDVSRRTYEYLGTTTKWTWLKQWLISCRSDFETNQARLELFLSGNETFWSFEMQAFLGETYRVEYPGSADYTQDTYANGWRPPITLETLQEEVEEKVDKEEGKGLSTNDFTNLDKEVVSKVIAFNGDSTDLENDILERWRNNTEIRKQIIYYGDIDYGAEPVICVANLAETEPGGFVYGMVIRSWKIEYFHYNAYNHVFEYNNPFLQSLGLDNKVNKRDLYDDGIIKETLLPDDVKNVLEFDKQVTGATFMDQILETEIGSILWIAANKSYTGDTYYRKFAINIDGTQANLMLIDPKFQTIYVGKTESNCFRWTGSNLLEISKSISLGESTTTAYQGSKGKTNADNIASLQEASILNTIVIPSTLDNKTYRYIGENIVNGLKPGDLFRLIQKRLETERIITSHYPDNLTATSLPIIIKNGFKIVFTSDYTSNILYDAKIYNQTNGIDQFPQIQYASGGYVYIIFNSSGERLQIHNSWNGGFVESFSNSYVTWDKTTRTLTYIGNEESIFDLLSTNSLGQAEFILTTVEMVESVVASKLAYEIPNPPTTEGTYKLQVEVDASGNPTYSWVVE